MNTLYIVIITILGTLFVCDMSNRLYKRIKHQFGRLTSVELRTDFQDKSITDLEEIAADLGMWHKRLERVEDITDNFDRDMDKFNAEVMRDVNARFEGMTTGERKFKKGLGNVFKLIHELAKNVDLDRGTAREDNEELEESLIKRLKKLEKCIPFDDNVFKHFVDDKFRMIEGKIRILEKSAK